MREKEVLERAFAMRLTNRLIRRVHIGSLTANT
jgi:hypothetical protein